MALTDYVIMPGSDYQAICDSVRAKTGSSEPLKSGEVAAAVEGIQAAPKGTVKRCAVRYSEGTIHPYFVEGMTWADLMASTHNAIYMTAAFVDWLYQPVFAVTEDGGVKIAPIGETVCEILPGLGTMGDPVKASELISDSMDYCTTGAGL